MVFPAAHAVGISRVTAGPFVDHVAFVGPAVAAVVGEDDLRLGGWVGGW
jgi:hypothetical protein